MKPLSNSEPSSDGSDVKASIWPDIPFKQKLQAIEDPLAFKPNRCSPNARLLKTHSHSSHYELWIDKHYHNRHQVGDANGRREGIEPDVVESLVRRAFGHLLFYGSSVKNFIFINNGGRPPVRVVVQELKELGLLSVPIEVHAVEFNKYEVTILTAMCSPDFKVESGQYVVELDVDGSVLKKLDNKKLVEIAKI